MRKFFRVYLQNPEILFIALLSVLIHLAVAGNLEYHRDELLYFSLGLRNRLVYDRFYLLAENNSLWIQKNNGVILSPDSPGSIRLAENDQ